jgi:hypothetical protein
MLFLRLLLRCRMLVESMQRGGRCNFDGAQLADPGGYPELRGRRKS